ncbi:MAG: hypothetical protein IH595_08110 [Bacteroidales bacterium]|nr:hypothetical protein [Bacteroidales bacterium]
MKKIVLLLVLSFLTLGVYSQNPNSSVYFKAGVSFPLFDLANGNPSDTTSGLAAKGLHVEVGYNLPLSAHWGMGLAAIYYGNRYSHNKFDNYYGSLLSDAAYGLKTNYAWSVGGLVLRPAYLIPFTKNISWEIYASGGFLAFFTPEYVVNSTSLLNNKTSTYHQNRDKGYSFAYGLGTRFNFKMFNTHFFVDADFLTSNIKYHSTGTDWLNQPFNYPVKQKIGYLSVNFGYTIFL